MAGNTQPMGIQAIIQGLGNYLSGINQMNNATQNFAKNTQAQAGAKQPFSFGNAALDIFNTLIPKLFVFIAAASLVVRAINAIADALINAAKAAASFVIESVQGAAREDELRLAADLLAQRQGYAQEQTEALMESIEKLGFRGDSAAKTIAQLARYDLDLSKATELATIAQNASILTGESASDTLDQIVQSIINYNQRGLRSAGVNADVAASQAAMADALGKTTGELTYDEQVQATYNAVLAEGTRLTGLNTLAQFSAAKQMRSLGTDMEKLRDAVGKPFQAAYLNVALTLRQVVQSLTAAVSPGGSLYPILIALGGAASFLTEKLKVLVGAAIETGNSFVNNLAGPISKAVTDAFNWGVNIITNLATGIVNAAASVLTWAMNYVSGLLSSWLAPGSPPKVAPKIDKWGADAMTEYLKGFQDADFSVLSSMESAFKGAINALVGLGQIKDQEAANKIIANQTLNLAKLEQQYKQTGKVNEQLLSKIIGRTGAFGKELATYIRDQLALVGALDAQAAAEKRLKAAQDAFAKSDQRVNALTREYNALLRSGASKDVLDRKLAEINAAEKAREVAAENVTTSEDEVAAAKAKAEELQNQAKLQEQLIQQLTQLAQAQARQKEAETAAAAAGAGGGGVPGAPTIPTDFSKIDIAGTIGKAVEEAKKKIAEAWNAFWTGLITSFQTKTGPALTALGTAFSGLMTRLQPVWTGIQNGWNGVWTWLQTQGQWFGGVFKGFWDKYGADITFVFTTVWNFVVSYFQQKINEFLATAQVIWPIIVNVFNQALDYIGNYLKIKWEEFKIVVRVALDFIGGLFSVFALLLKTDWAELWDKVKATIETAWINIKQGVQGAWDDLVETFTRMGAQLKEDWDTFWQDIITGIGKIASDFFTAGVDIIQGLIDGINSLWNDLKAKLSGVASLLPDWLKKLLGISSPSKVFMGIGENLMAGLSAGITNSFKDLEVTMRNTALKVETEMVASAAHSPYAAPTTMAVGGSSVNFGVVNINNEMDYQLFAARVKDAVIKGLR